MRVFSFTVYYYGWPYIKRFGIAAYDMKQARNRLRSKTVKAVMAIELQGIR